METQRVLVPESLQETLWRLEEVRQGFRSSPAAQVQEALEWVLARQGLPGSYRGLFLPTPRDLAQGARFLTGERMPSMGGARHVLGEEALRTAIVWNQGTTPAVTRALSGLKEILDRGGKDGFYCCYSCTTAFLRTMAAVKLKEREVVLDRGVARMETKRKPDGRWGGYPFYYTLLTLSEMDTRPARNELRHAGGLAERLLKRTHGDDRTSRFRRLALERTLKVVQASS